MSVLDDFRKKYPAYAKTPDDQLATGIYKKFYAGKLTREQFDAKLGTPVAATAPAEHGAITRGFVSQTLKGNPTAVAESLEAFSHLAEDPTYSRNLREMSEGLRSAAQQPAGYEAKTQGLEDIEGIGSGLTYLGERAGEAVASTVPAVVSGGVGGFIGSRVGGKYAAMIGGLGGAALSAYPMNQGDFYQALKEEGVAPKVAAEWSAYGAIPITTLDVWTPAGIVSRLTGTARKEAYRNIAKRVVQESLKNAGKEAGTEATQQLIQEGLVNQATGKPWTGEDVKRIIEAGISGGLGGGILGGAAGVAPDRKPAPDVSQTSAVPAGAQPAETILGATPGASGAPPAATPPTPPAAPPPATSQPAPAAAPPARTFADLLREHRKQPEARQINSHVQQLVKQKARLEANNVGNRFGPQLAALNTKLVTVQRDAAPLLEDVHRRQVLRANNLGGRYNEHLRLLDQRIADARTRMDFKGTIVPPAVSPTPAQAEAGNYRHRPVTFGRLNVSIETEAGTARTGIGADGKPWSAVAPFPYGYIKKTTAADSTTKKKQGVDITLGPDPSAPNVFIIDQVDPKTRKWDEHKTFGGFPDAAAAINAYDASFSDGSGPDRRGAITAMPVADFEGWVRKARNTRKALAYKGGTQLELFGESPGVTPGKPPAAPPIAAEPAKPTPIPPESAPLPAEPPPSADIKGVDLELPEQSAAESANGPDLRAKIHNYETHLATWPDDPHAPKWRETLARLKAEAGIAPEPELVPSQDEVAPEPEKPEVSAPTDGPVRHDKNWAPQNADDELATLRAIRDSGWNIGTSMGAWAVRQRYASVGTRFYRLTGLGKVRIAKLEGKVEPKARPEPGTPEFDEEAGRPTREGEPTDPRYIVNPLTAKTPGGQAQQLQALGRENEKIVAPILAKIDAALGTKSGTNHKTRANILAKAKRPSILARKPWHGVEHIRDAFRFKTVVNRLEDIPAALAMLREAGIEVVKADTKKMIDPAEWGWRFAAFDLRMPNGQLVEWYLPFKELEAAKKAGNHLLFEKWRDTTDAYREEHAAAYMAALALSTQRYEAAWAAALERLHLDDSAARASWISLSASLGSRTIENSSRSSVGVTVPLRQTPPSRTANKSSSSTETRPSSSIETGGIGSPPSAPDIATPEANDKETLPKAPPAPTLKAEETADERQGVERPSREPPEEAPSDDVAPDAGAGTTGEPSAGGGRAGGAPGARDGAAVSGEEPAAVGVHGSGGASGDGEAGGRGDREPEPDPGAGGGRRPGDDAGSLHGLNYAITDDAAILPKGEKTRAKLNIAAITLLKEIEARGTPATAAEQDTLAKFTGWGAIPGIFDFNKDGWRKERDALRAVVSEDEWAAARASTPNAHYTSPAIARAIWSIVRKMGFDRGRVLEPSMGTGIFYATMPKGTRGRSSLAGVELDTITAGIAKQLFQGAEIRQGGFEAQVYPNNFFDLAIGNVPFGDFGVVDPNYKRAFTSSIHNYFFVRTLDLVRPGGLVVFLTSRYTMDAVDPAIRQELARKADLLGSFRLPDDTFAGIANTEVVTDLIVLRKRGINQPPAGAAFATLKAQTVPGKPGAKPQTVPINTYYADHPEHILGAQLMSGKMNRRGDGYNVVSNEGQDTPKLLVERGGDLAASYAPADDKTPATRPPVAPAEAPGTVKEGAFFLGEKGELLRKEYGKGVPARGGDTVKALVGLRDQAKQLIRAQIEPSLGLDTKVLRKRLNADYDKFVKRFGFINLEAVSTRVDAKSGKTIKSTRRPNFTAFRDDPDAFLVAALEVFDSAKNTATKSTIFEHDVLGPAKTVTSVGTPREAIPLVLNEVGFVDIARVAQLSGVPVEEAISQLKGDIYPDPETSQWATRDEYLSGNVRRKLKMAEAAAAVDARRYGDNVEALKAVQPKDLIPHTDKNVTEIVGRLGAAWIEPTIIEQFAKELMGVDRGVRIQYSPATAAWKVAADRTIARMPKATNELGTGRAPFFDILNANLNSSIIKLYDPGGRDSPPVLNVEDTKAAQIKQKELHEAFEAWVWKDAERAQKLARVYNDEYNNLVKRTIDGSHLTFPGIAEYLKTGSGIVKFALRPHQKSAVWRMLTRGNTLLSHAVGSGKTFAMIGAGIEGRRLGLFRRPLYAVPNHMLEQFAREFLQAYPNARLLVADKNSFTKEKRLLFSNRIATGDYDAIIITHAAFGKLPMSDKAYKDYYDEQIAEIVAEVTAAKKDQGDDFTVKQLEKLKKRLEKKLATVMAREKKDVSITFEETGIDQIFVDEAHLFKKLGLVTRMGNVRGVDSDSSQRAVDLFIKTQYLDSRTPGKGTVFATATPITNTMGELYNMQRFLQLRALKDKELQHFDAWARTFGNVAETQGVNPSGRGLRTVARFAEFLNIPELSAMFAEVSDLQTAEMLNLPRPMLKSGKPIAIDVPPTAAQVAKVDDLVQRAEEVKGKRPEKGADNMLRIVTEGRKAATDMRLLDDRAADDPGSKVNVAIDNMFRIWKEGKEPGLAQMVFLDLGTPGKKKKKAMEMADDDAPPAQATLIEDLDEEISDEDLADAIAAAAEADAFSDDTGFNLYDDMRNKLVARGVPREQIVFIHEAKDDAAKFRLFNDVNSGRVRFLFGSTEKMGVGTNAQQRLIAMHHIDAPWRPSDVEQRDGRILRQGNLNPEVQIYRYVTTKTFDAYMWQALEQKAGFIGQFLAGGKGKRRMEDVDSPLPDAATMKALATGDPRFMELAKTTHEVDNLQVKERSWERALSEAQWRLRHIDKEIADAKKAIAGFAEDAAKVQPLNADSFRITIGKQDYAKRADAAPVLQKILNQLALKTLEGKKGFRYDLGSISGFPASLTTELYRGDEVRITPVIKGVSGDYYGNSFYVTAKEGPSGLGFLDRFQGAVEYIPGRLATARKDLAETQQKKVEYTAQAAKGSFPEAAKLRQMEARIRALESELQEKPPEKKAEQKPIAASATPAGWDKIKGIAGAKYDLLAPGVSTMTNPVTARKREAVKRQITEMIVRMSGNRKTRLEVADSIFGGADNHQWGGLYHPARNLIALSLEGYGDTEWRGRHEIIHLMRDMGIFTPAEWMTLVDHVVHHGLMARHNIAERYPKLDRAAQLEEAIAETFGEGRSTLWTGLPGPVRRILLKLATLLDRIAAAVRRVFGRQATVADIFSGIESGYYAQRAAGDVESGGGEIKAMFERRQDAADAAREAEARSGVGWYIEKRGDYWWAGTRNVPLEALGIPLTPEQRAARKQMDAAGFGRGPQFSAMPAEEAAAPPPAPAMGPNIPNAPARQAMMQNWLSRGQPIDRALRLPFDFFGGLDAQGRWVSGEALYKKHAAAVTGALIGARLGAAVTNPFGALIGHGVGRLIGGKAGGVFGEAAGAFTGGLPGAAVGAALGASAGVLFQARFSKDGRMAWLNPTLEMARTGLIDRYGLSDAYINLDRKRGLDERRGMMQGVEIVQGLKMRGVEAAEAKVLQAILTEGEIGSPEMMLLSEPIRNAIDSWGAELVSLGFVSAESFERNRGKYLHRLYMKHERDSSALPRFVGNLMRTRRKRLIGDELKGRGIFLEEDMPRVMRDAPGFQEGTAGPALKGQSVIVLDRIPENEQEKLALEEQGQRRSVPKVVDRVFWPADKPVPPRFADYTDRGTWEVRQVKGRRVTLWRDYTKDERAQMGEILDARYTITKTFMLMAHDVATGRFYKDIATNEDWAQSTEPPEKWIDAEEWQKKLHRYSKHGGVEWVKVPDSTISDTGGVKRWGALAGKYVREEIWRDLNELEIMSNPHWWRKVMTSWKLMKTARSPTVHHNNIASNFVLMDMADVRWQDLVRGVRSYATGDDDYQDAVNHGVFGGDMMSAEIRKTILEPIMKEMERDLVGAGTSAEVPFGAIGKLAERIWSTQVKQDGLTVRGVKIWQGKLGIGAFDEWMRTAYRVEDDVFKMAAYMRHKATGLSAEDAASAAREEFIDYDIRAPWINVARNSVLPFVSYSYRATPLVARMVATRPWKLAKYALIAYMINALGYLLVPGDEDDERRSLDPALQGYTWLGTPRMIRMPDRDGNGNPVFWDIRRMIPVSDIFDPGREESPLPAILTLGGPLILAMELVMNKSAFTGEPIINTLTDSWWEKTTSRVDFAYKAWVPSAAWVPGSWYWTKILEATTGARDWKGQPLQPEYVIPSAFGVKLKPQDVEAGFYFQKAKIRDSINAFGDKARDAKKDLARNRISKATFEARMEDIRARVAELQQQARTLRPTP